MIRPNLSYTPDFVTDPGRLFATVRDEVNWTQQMKSRRTASMGVPYNYTSASYPVAEWHPAVQALRERVAEAVGFMPTNCLLNDYPTGAHRLGWHCDDVSILEPGTGIAIVSLGAERPLGLRTRGDAGFVYQQIVLAEGSLLYLSPEMQADWQHAILASPTPDERISLSFRHIVRW